MECRQWGGAVQFDLCCPAARLWDSFLVHPYFLLSLFYDGRLGHNDADVNKTLVGLFRKYTYTFDQVEALTQLPNIQVALGFESYFLKSATVTKTILIVDDHPLFREGTGLLISQYDPTLEAIFAGSIEGALEFVK